MAATYALLAPLARANDGWLLLLHVCAGAYLCS